MNTLYTKFVVGRRSFVHCILAGRSQTQIFPFVVKWICIAMIHLFGWIFASHHFPDNAIHSPKFVEESNMMLTTSSTQIPAFDPASWINFPPKSSLFWVVIKQPKKLLLRRKRSRFHSDPSS